MDKLKLRYLIREAIENVANISLTENIEGAKWTKLICNTMTMGPIGLTGLKNWDARKLPGMFDMSVALGRESMAVGKALGYELEPIFGMSAEEFSQATDETLIKAVETLMEHIGKEGVTAPIHDHLKGRKSEMSLINGLVAEKGKEFNSITFSIPFFPTITGTPAYNPLAPYSPERYAAQGSCFFKSFK